MDNIDPRLKDLILFINQNSQFNIYAIELKYYKKGGLEILAPDLHGAEVRKRAATAGGQFSASSAADFWLSVETGQAVEIVAMKRLAEAIESSVQNDADFKYMANPAGEQVAYISTKQRKFPLLLYASGKLALYCKSDNLYSRANRVLLMRLSKAEMFLSGELKPEKLSFRKLDLSRGTVEEIDKLTVLYQQAIEEVRANDS